MATVNPIRLQTYLKGVDYPATKQDLQRAAEREGADEQTRRALEQLPDQTYRTPAEVSEALGKGD